MEPAARRPAVAAGRDPARCAGRQPALDAAVRARAGRGAGAAWQDDDVASAVCGATAGRRLGHHLCQRDAGTAGPGRWGAPCADRQPGGRSGGSRWHRPCARRVAGCACAVPGRFAAATGVDRSVAPLPFGAAGRTRGAARNRARRRAHGLSQSRPGFGAGAAAAQQSRGAAGRHRVLRGPLGHGSQRRRRGAGAGPAAACRRGGARVRPGTAVRIRRGAGQRRRLGRFRSGGAAPEAGAVASRCAACCVRVVM